MLIEEQLSSAIGDRRGAEAANSLCEACVTLFEVDAAAISLIFDGSSTGTLGSSSPIARTYDELQFTFGEGPCLDSVRKRAPVLVADLSAPGETRWPGYGPAMLSLNVRSVYAMPVVLTGEYVGALDLYRAGPSMLDAEQLAGALAAAALAEMPLLDVLADDIHAAVGHIDGNAWTEMTSLTRVEVSQATGMLMAQLEVDSAEALIRLRAYAYATNRSASSVARDILERGLRLEIDQ